MSAGKHGGCSLRICPGTGELCRLVNVTMEGKVWLSFLDKPFYGYASYMDIKRHVIDHFAVKISSVKIRIVRWRMKQQYGAVEAGV